MVGKLKLVFNFHLEAVWAKFKKIDSYLSGDYRQYCFSPSYEDGNIEKQTEMNNHLHRKFNSSLIFQIKALNIFSPEIRYSSDRFAVPKRPSNSQQKCRLLISTLLSVSTFCSLVNLRVVIQGEIFSRENCDWDQSWIDLIFTNYVVARISQVFTHLFFHYVKRFCWLSSFGNFLYHVGVFQHHV